jgi:hypothetical protein
MHGQPARHMRLPIVKQQSTISLDISQNGLTLWREGLEEKDVIFSIALTVNFVTLLSSFDCRAIIPDDALKTNVPDQDRMQ